MGLLRARSAQGIALVIALLASGSRANAQQAKGDSAQVAPSKEALEEARVRYERGTQLYGEGSFELSLIEFQRAYDLAPSYKLLYNIAQVSAQLGNFAQALRMFERYLKEGAKDIPGKRRAEIEKEIASLRNRTATLEIVTDVEGVEIAIDDVVVGTTPFAQPLLVNAGRRSITASKGGRVPAKKVLTLAGADQFKIEFQLPELPPPLPQVVQPIRERTIIHTAPDSGGSAVWIGWAATGVLTAGAVVVGVLTLGKQSDLKNLRDSPTATRESLDDAQKTVQTHAIITDVLIGSAAVAGAVSLYFTLSGGSSTPEKTGTTVGIGVTPTGGHFAGRF